jgi:transcriptional regulator with XRE-family HTH domain
MSIVRCDVSEEAAMHGAAVRLPCAARPLHRLAAVRQQQGVTRRTLARRLNTEANHVKWQEQATSDLLLSALYEWQEVLEVPVAELLVEPGEPLSAPVLKRAQMVRLMKTAVTILERTQQVGIRRMARMLVEQLVEIMPELAGVCPWPIVGQRRTQNELGQAAQRQLSANVLWKVGE